MRTELIWCPTRYAHFINCNIQHMQLCAGNVQMRDLCRIPSANITHFAYHCIIGTCLFFQNTTASLWFEANDSFGSMIKKFRYILSSILQYKNTQSSGSILWSITGNKLIEDQHLLHGIKQASNKKEKETKLRSIYIRWAGWRTLHISHVSLL
jgi:hypothetical protein